MSWKLKMLVQKNYNFCSCDVILLEKQCILVSPAVYTFCILQVFHDCFPDTHHEIRNTNYTLFVFHSNFVFRLRNHLTFRANADPDAKMRKSDTKYLAIHILFFVFCELFPILPNECIADLMGTPSCLSYISLCRCAIVQLCCNFYSVCRHLRWKYSYCFISLLCSSVWILLNLLFRQPCMSNDLQNYE